MTEHDAAQNTTLIAARQIYDAEADAFVERTTEQQRRAVELLENIAGAEITQSINLAEFADGKHYLDLGFSSMKAFAGAMMPDVSYATTKRRLQIGRKFRPVLAAAEGSPVSLMETQRNGANEESKGSPVSLLDDPTLENSLISQVGTLGMRKLLALTRLDDTRFEEVVRDGTLVMHNDQTYTLDDLKRMKTDQMEELVRQHRTERKAYQTRAMRLEEENRKLKSEQKAERDQVEAAREQLEKAGEMERLYGPARRDFEGALALLQEADEHIMRFRKAIMNIDLPEDLSGTLQNKLVAVLREANAAASDARLLHADAIAEASDAIALETDWDPEMGDAWADIEADNAPAADRHAVSVTINGVAYEPWTATLEATGPDDLTRLLEENADQLPLDVTPDDVRAWAESVWGSLCALPEKARFCDILSQAGITVERAANLDHDEDAADYLLFEAGWEHETRTNSDGFSESRFANPIENLSTMWCQTYDQAVEHAMTLSRKAP